MLNARNISSVAIAPRVCKQRKSGGTRPRARIDRRGAAVGQHARQILGDAAAGDVRHPLDESRVEQRPHRAQVRPMRREQRLADASSPSSGTNVVRREAADVEEHAARQRIAVGVQTGRRQADQHIARHDASGHRSMRLAIDDADDEAGDVVFAVGVEAGHLRGLAADQRAAVLAAAARDAGDDLLGDVGRQPAGRQVVEEEQRPRALHEDVVDAVVDEIGADRVVPAGHERDLQLRADAVRARHEHRLAEARRRSSLKRPPNDPISDSTPGVNVARASDLMRRTVSLPASMSTPDWR